MASQARPPCGSSIPLPLVPEAILCLRGRVALRGLSCSSFRSSPRAFPLRHRAPSAGSCGRYSSGRHAIRPAFRVAGNRRLPSLTPHRIGARKRTRRHSRPTGANAARSLAHDRRVRQLATWSRGLSLRLGLGTIHRAALAAPPARVRGYAPVLCCVDTYVPGPPYSVHWPRVPAACMVYVPEAQGSLPRGATHWVRVRAESTVFPGTPGGGSPSY